MCKAAHCAHHPGTRDAVIASPANVSPVPRRGQAATGGAQAPAPQDNNAEDPATAGGATDGRDALWRECRQYRLTLSKAHAPPPTTSHRRAATRLLLIDRPRWYRLVITHRVREHSTSIQDLLTTHLPRGQRLIELCGTLKHTTHIHDLSDIPCGQRLVESLRQTEHITHIGDLANIPGG